MHKGNNNNSDLSRKGNSSKDRPDDSLPEYLSESGELKTVNNEIIDNHRTVTVPRARILRVLYENNETGERLLRFKQSGPAFVARGFIPDFLFNLGAFYDLTGRWYYQSDKRRVFHFDTLVASLPTQEEFIYAFLTTTGFVRGLSKAVAKTMVETWHEETLVIAKNSYKTLTEINGIGPKLAENIHNAVKNFEEAAEVYATLFKMGVEPDGILNLYKEYGSQTLDNLRNTPYQISRQHPDIMPFVVADRLSLQAYYESKSKSGEVVITKDNMDAFYIDSRIYAGILETLRRACEEGHTYLIDGALIENATWLLSINPIIMPGGSPDPDRDLISKKIASMIQEMKASADITLVEGNDGMRVYLPAMRRAEERVCERLYEIAEAPLPESAKKPIEYEPNDPFNTITYSFEQMEAITSAMSNMFMVITGGPGTGKTTIMAEIVRRHLDFGRKIALAAPTAKAADRMRDVTGLDSCTIQRMIRFRPDSTPLHNQTNPISADVVIVDEFSMVDVDVMEKLVNAIAPGTFFLAIGDVDQLPSVGPGNVFGDIMESKGFVVRRLSRIFRQKNRSSIPELAAAINEGCLPDTSSMDDVELHWCRPEEMRGIVTKRVSELIGEFRESRGQIRVITPLRGGDTGSQAYSEILRDIFNPVNPNDIIVAKNEDGTTYTKNIAELDFSPYGRFRVGDRVIQGVNCYRSGVMNGEEGTIESISPDGLTMNIRFNHNRLIAYTVDDVREAQLELAYAITVHKSQGSEYPVVFLIIPPEAGSMMNRKLIYTAITRARGKVLIYGSYTAMTKGLAQKGTTKRNSGLLDLFSERVAENSKDMKSSDDVGSKGTEYYNVMVDGMSIPLFDMDSGFNLDLLNSQNPLGITDLYPEEDIAF